MHADENTPGHVFVGGLIAFGVGQGFHAFTGQENKWAAAGAGFLAAGLANLAHEGMNAGDRNLPLDQHDLITTQLGAALGTAFFLLVSEDKPRGSGEILPVGPLGSAGALFRLGF